MEKMNQRCPISLREGGRGFGFFFLLKKREKEFYLISSLSFCSFCKEMEGGRRSVFSLFAFSLESRLKRFGLFLLLLFVS